MPDAYDDITEQELERNIRDILRFTPFSGETYLRGALRAWGIYILRWKAREALQTIDLINRAIRRIYDICHPKACIQCKKAKSSVPYRLEPQTYKLEILSYTSILTDIAGLLFI